MNPELDLVLDRTADVDPSFVWDAWTQPELLKRWFCPLPWTTPHVEMDLRPGGVFRTVMRGPDGEEADNMGCFIEIVPKSRLVWTSALGPGFRPQATASHVPFMITAVITIDPAPGGGTHYRATVLHADAEACRQHAAMGFEAGWGAAFDQLVALAKA